jgi:hypothetical protein
VSEIKDMLKALYPMLLTSNAQPEARVDEQSRRIDDLSRTVAANTQPANSTP